MQQRYTVMAIVEREQARVHRRIEQAKSHLEKLQSQPTAHQDGDDDSRVDHARERDRVEYELDLAEAAAETLRSLTRLLEEALAPEAEEQQRIRTRGRDVLVSKA